MWFFSLLLAVALAQDVPQRLEAAEAAVAGGQPGEARKDLEALLARSLEPGQRGDALFWLAQAVGMEGELSRALELAAEAREAYRRAGQDEALGASWLLSSHLAQATGDSDLTLALTQEGHAELTGRFGAQSPAMAEHSERLAHVYGWRGEYVRAGEAADLAIAQVAPVAETVPGPWERLLGYAGQYHYKAGQSEAAVHRYRQMLEVVKARTDEAHPDRILPEELLGLALTEQGSLEEADVHLTRALALSKLAGQAPVERITLLSNMSSLRKRQGDYAAAAKRQREAVAAARSDPERGAGWLPILLSNLGGLQMTLGEREGAVETLREAVQLSEARWGSAHPSTGTTLLGLGAALEAVGEMTEALEVTERGLAVQQATLPVGHPSLATGWTNLATLALRTGDAEGAAAALALGLPHIEALPAHHPERAWWAETQAELAGTLQQREEERRWRAEAVAHRTAWQGATHPLTLNARLLAAATGEGEQARTETDAVLRATARVTDELLGVLGDAERMRWLADRRRALDLWLELHPEASQEAWQHVLAWKGLSLRATLARREAVRASADPEIIAIAEAFDEARRALAEAMLASAEGNAEVHAALVRQRRAEVETLEEHLAGLDDAWRTTPPTPAILCAALGPDAVLVDLWRRGAELPYAAAPRYEAFVLRGEACEVVERLDLGEAEHIEQAVRRWRRALRQPTTRLLDEAALEVRLLVLDPMRSLLGDAERVVVVPDGVLSQVAWSTLPLDDGRYLLETRAIEVASQAGDLLPGGERRVGKGALVVSAVDYGAGGERSRHRGLRACLGESFAPLPGTRSEGRLVARQLRQRGLGTQRLTGERATEAAVLEALPGRRVVHLATHGFFAGSCHQEQAPTDLESAGLRSGLVLAGANLTEGSSDGLWTAAEVATLDLSGLELAVLSACETGLGEVVSGEGVLGLQRAFTEAGAQNVVMSLWAVEDEATRALMTRFYRRLRTQEDPAVALRGAQLSLLASNRGSGGARPWTWGAFVLSRRQAGP